MSAYKPISTKEERTGLFKSAPSEAACNVAVDCITLLARDKLLTEELERLRMDREPKMDGGEMICVERFSQIERGYDADHDDKHCNGELLQAALSYLRLVMEKQAAEQSPHGSSISSSDHEYFEWPFEKESWSPKDNPIETLTVAGSFIAAEIDRLKREDSWNESMTRACVT